MPDEREDSSQNSFKCIRLRAALTCLGPSQYSSDLNSTMKRHKPADASRRELLKGALGASAAAYIGSTAQAAAKIQADPALIKRENQKAGARDWQLTNVRLDIQHGYRSSLIE